MSAKKGGANVSAIAKRYETVGDCDDSAHHSSNGDCCHHNQPQRYYGGNLYHPAPSATTLEININQHNPSPAPSYYSASPVMAHHPHRHAAPGASPPPPPPPQQEYANPNYTSHSSPALHTKTQMSPVRASAPPLVQPPKPPTSSPPPTPGAVNTSAAKRSSVGFPNNNNNKSTTGKNALLSSNPKARRKTSRTLRLMDVLTSRENSVMFRVCVVQLLLSIVVLLGGIWCAREIPNYCPYYSGLWTASLFIINSLLGIVAAKMAMVNLYVAHLVLSLVSMVVCVMGGLVAARNWESVGTYRHPKISRDHAFCVLGEHDASRISYIFSHMDKYDFRKCLFELKVGIAVNSVQFAAVAILFLLYLFSAILCMKRTCTRCR